MVSSKSELATEIREFGQYTTDEISQSGINTAIDRAEKHLLAETDLDNPDWWDDEFPNREEAFFWTAMLFSKVVSGDLDSKTIAVGAIKEKSLLAKEGDEATFWYRQYKRYRDSLITTNKTFSNTRRTSRTSQGGERQYGRD